MSEKRNDWHYGFGVLVDDEKPDSFSLETKVTLAEWQQADLLLLRQTAEPTKTTGPLKQLWPFLPEVTLMEYKSRGRPPEPGVFSQLLAYGLIFDRRRRSEVPSIDDLALVLATGSKTSTVTQELKRYSQRFRLARKAKGLYRVRGANVPLWLLLLDEAAEEPGASVLGYFGTRPSSTLSREAIRWIKDTLMGNTALKDLRPDNDMVKALLDGLSPEQLALLGPEQLANLRPEQLANLRPEQLANLRPEQLANLRPEQLANLRPEQLVATLKQMPSETREAILDAFKSSD